MAAIEEGLEQVQNVQNVSHEEVMERIYRKWHI